MSTQRTIENWWVDYADEWWKEYPEVDREYITVYPCDFHAIDPASIWQKKEVSFYVHIPFCADLCKFCVFPKRKYGFQEAQTYIHAIQKEIAMYVEKPYINTLEASSIYFGGGTPTSLSPEQLEQLIDYVLRHLNISNSAEITIEAYPTTIDQEKLLLLRQLGVNRISFGAQSFNNQYMEAIGLFHRRDDNFRAIELAQSAGFSKVGIDLMFRLPGQTLDGWKVELETAVKTGIDSLSCYSFALLPGTGIHKESPAQADDKTDFQMYHLAGEVLESNGYHQYTVADFALEGKECKYLNNIWGTPPLECLGFGAGAITYLINGHAFWNIHHLGDYIATVDQGKLPIMMGQKVSADEMMSRFMVLGLRRLKVSRHKFRDAFNIDIVDVYAQQIQELKESGLIEMDDDFVTLTKLGKIYIDNISKKFFSSNNIGKIQPIGTELQRIRSVT